MSDNPSFVLKGILNVEIQQKPVPEIGVNEVLVEVRKTGSYFLQVHFLVHGRVGDFIVEKLMASDFCYQILGHESAGVVSKVGSSVTNVKVGDRVAMEPAATCRKCEACKEGRFQASMQICPDIVCAATPPTDGTLARYYRLSSYLAYPLPPNLSLEDGAMVRKRLTTLDFLDASGADVAIQTGILIAKSGGTFIQQVGIRNPDITIDMFAVLCKELVVRGSFRYGDYPLAIALVALGKVDIKFLVSHHFPFTQACEAFEIIRNGKSPDGKGAIKVMISGPDVDISEV
ncbi:putative alcohol dehydrogenase [Suillus occidentalis]|nr:putative alcohol dehydrogenase [Suillus occidentalis]